MHPDSISWTTFTCLEGHFEWLAMSLGIKIAPQVFQRKMDPIFKNIEKFMCVYIDDILVFSETKTKNFTHLHIVFTLLEKH